MDNRGTVEFVRETGVMQLRDLGHVTERACVWLCE